ncbi:helix-turn-helix transcriptional regulator [Streptomyces sp. ASQP_92]|uniref:helix-turn-helix transcriptional regulator n=1 Tax=Streptomyces sp. ASQP_92 TaxID=2979116 RepID=UPI0021BDFF1B|nr:helix-turn-helix transcriptional regulator [Streptomyces sp. ASQP_92]MCT9092246.1 helix-turn-helix transcriptional regulator [Streptomyces sp. ASQP_92]
MTDNDLGDFLRARRASVRPEHVGMVSHGTRRVPGLRREELAVLAGVNADYCARLEQGRERNPSPQVLRALGHALRLDPEARAHLFRLAGAVPEGDRRPAPAGVSPTLRRLMDGYPHTPAFVINRTLDVLAANALTDALYSPFETVDNLARMAFLDPAARRFYPLWDRTAEATVANLREAAGFEPSGPRLRELVTLLGERSPEFARLWTAHAVRGKARDAKRLHHPEVGALSLTYHAFDVRDAPGQQLIIYHAEPRSPSADALGLLGSMHATARPGSARS